MGHHMTEYELITDLRRFDVEAIHAFLSRSYWSPGIPLEIVRRAMEGSLCFGLQQGAQLVAFARVITDKATFAYLADVFVVEAHRGRGLSARLMQAIVAHPDLKGLRRMLLATRDAHGLYAKFGFKPLAAPERFMEVHVPDVYGSA
jgi:GNAT superfamily N-acetyltransferase